MKHRQVFFLIGISMSLVACSVSKNPLRVQFKQLQKLNPAEDTSFVYALPFEEGKAFRVIQGYFSHFSHWERAALDFNLRRGSKIAAARGGIVVRVKEDGDRGGLNKKYRAFGNNIVIQHEDGSRAGYWHLKKDGALVNVGDTVYIGQIIAISGKTGYAAVPHLHFLVWKITTSGWQQVATRFQTTKGPRYLVTWRKYRKPVNG